MSLLSGEFSALIITAYFSVSENLQGTFQCVWGLLDLKSTKQHKALRKMLAFILRSPHFDCEQSKAVGGNVHFSL